MDICPKSFSYTGKICVKKGTSLFPSGKYAESRGGDSTSNNLQNLSCNTTLHLVCEAYK
jgi:hypothetical protein